MKDNLVFGLHPVQALLEHAPDNIEILYIAKAATNPRVQSLIALAERAGVRVQYADKNLFAGLMDSDQNAQGVIAKINNLPQFSEQDIPAILQRATSAPLLLILDSIQDPHNLGACLRTANAAGVHAVIAPKDKACALTPAARKVACGADLTTPFITVTNLARSLRELQEQNVWLVGTDGLSTQSLYATDLKGPIGMVMGAEGTGLRRLSKEICDYLVYIPMFGTVSSLNVSVATAVCLYEAVRQRQN